ncbi:MAG: RNA polymerase sigma factor [Woeseiaceae bacterium]|nr:RNA polymerase sigma factor [Woeseiaceae bacterium]
MRDGDALDNNPEIARSALEAIHSQVFGWALSRCDYDRSVAEDLMQQAYVEILSGAARFRGESTLKTFVFSIVQNLARGRYRRLASRLRLTRQHADEQDESYTPEANHSDIGIWQAVTALPARQRDVIELVFLCDMTIEEASMVMGVSLGTGRTHYDRAKKALRQQLDQVARDLL